MNTITHPVDRLAGRATAALLLLVLAACSTQPTGVVDDDEPTVRSAQWRLDFADCLRGEGIDVEDPGANGAIGASGPEDETPERQAATEKCLEELGPQPVADGDDGADGPVEQEQLQIAACLREHGFDVPDPAAGDSLVLPENLTEEVAEACGADSTGPVAPR